MVRKSKVEDIGRVMEIWLESNLDAHSFVKPDYWISNASLVRKQLLQAELYVFEQKNKILGFAGMQENYLAGIFISKDSRLLGFGKQLLDYIKGNHESISLNVYKENRGAVKFYIREGFTMISENLDFATDCIEYLMQWKFTPVSIRKYRGEDCKDLMQLFYDTVHTVNIKDYSEEQVNVWATGREDCNKWNGSFLAHDTLVAT